MSASAIEWTERTWNPVVGCSVHSAGCTNCYAMTMAGRLEAMFRAGQDAMAHYAGTTQASKAGAVWTGTVNVAPDAIFLAPLKRKKPTTWFVNSMSDLFHDSVPDDVIDRVFAVMALCPQHRFQVLTKRADRMRAYLTDPATPKRVAAALLDIDLELNLPGALSLGALGNRARESDAEFVPMPLVNVWLGVSVEDQRAADARIPDLLATPAAVRFLSCEPLLGPVDLTAIPVVEDGDITLPKRDLLKLTVAELDDVLAGEGRVCPTLNALQTHPLLADYKLGASRIDWVIVGGESGPGARPMHPDWARGLRDQCAAAGVPFFFKQWGDWAPATDDEIPERFGPACDPFLTICSNGFVGQLSIGSAFIHKPARYPACFPNGADHDAICNSVVVRRVGNKVAGRLLDGVQHDGMPA